MATVFVLTGFVQYEGSYVLGVYSTREAAVAAADAFEDEFEEYDGYCVLEHQLDVAPRYDYEASVGYPLAAA